jgi:hypothetical protein
LAVLLAVHPDNRAMLGHEADGVGRDDQGRDSTSAPTFQEM